MELFDTMRTHPILLRVEGGGSLSLLDTEDGSLTDLRNDYSSPPRWWRWFERSLRLEISLAFRAKRLQDRCDIVWAGSENLGIALSLVGLQRPLVVIAHHMSSPAKARLAKALGIVKKWKGIGFISDEGRQFFIDYFGASPDSLFQYESCKCLDRAVIRDSPSHGPIMSVGVAKRDYETLIAALKRLPGYETELYTSSKFGDTLRQRLNGSLADWIHLKNWLSEEELLRRYERSRFVVVPLQATTHTGAGITAVLEAGAFGKAVIATRTGGLETFVKDGETGVLVPPYDVAAWSAAIHRFWTDPELAHQMGRAGRRYVEQHYDPVVINARILAFLDRLFRTSSHLQSVTWV